MQIAFKKTLTRMEMRKHYKKRLNGFTEMYSVTVDSEMFART